jgi:hypothetical protein
MNIVWKRWLFGLLAAFIGGGAGAFSSGIAANWLDPKDFNIAAGLRHMLALMGATFLISGATHAMAYLAQSPIPREVWSDEQRAVQLGGQTHTDSAAAGR